MGRWGERQATKENRSLESHEYSGYDTSIILIVKPNIVFGGWILVS